MKVIQGRYIGKIESNKGKLKGLHIQTEEGKHKIYLPKALREVAQAELTIEQSVRVWIDGDRSSNKKPYALQLIPLAPQLALQTSSASLQKPKKPNVKKKRSKNSKPAKSASKVASKVTVQICQKKNCCRKGGDELWNAFTSASAEHAFKLEPIGCLGGCKRGPNIRLLPDNVKYRHVQPAEVEGILQTHRA